MIYTPDILIEAGISPEGLVFCGQFPPYDPNLLKRSRSLRNDGTKAEAYLWTVLKQCNKTYRFSRQKPILHYIADFYCHQLSLVVEIDGYTHDGVTAQEHDRQRDIDMIALGLKIVRLNDNKVKSNPIEAAQQVFVAAGVPMPEEIDFIATGTERIFPEGYRRGMR